MHLIDQTDQRSTLNQLNEPNRPNRLRGGLASFALIGLIDRIDQINLKLSLCMHQAESILGASLSMHSIDHIGQIDSGVLHFVCTNKTDPRTRIYSRSPLLINLIDQNWPNPFQGRGARLHALLFGINDRICRIYFKASLCMHQNDQINLRGRIDSEDSL